MFDIGIGELVALAVIGLLIELFIESIMNFVVAIAWPVYWLSESRSPWLLLFAAYAGYWLGIRVAARFAREGQDSARDMID